MTGDVFYDRPRRGGCLALVARALLITATGVVGATRGLVVVVNIAAGAFLIGLTAVVAQDLHAALKSRETTKFGVLRNFPTDGRRR